MTNNDIIKALECCTTNGASCKDCPAFVKVDRSNCKKYFRGALDLINRQKAEIERLEELLDSSLSSERNVVDNIPFEKAEAYKEVFQAIDFMCIDTFGNFNHKAFINLKKEMVGDNE